MARLTAALQLRGHQQGGSEQELRAAVSQALLDLDLELVHTTRLQVAAAARAGGRWPSSLRVLIGWQEPATAVALELLSRESMVTGAPVSRQALAELITGLMAKLPGLEPAGN